MKHSPSLLSHVFSRFPDQKTVILRLLRDSDSFRTLCRDYQECANALAYWKRTRAEEAPLRRKEYDELLEELDQEIADHLQEESL
jgi:hypothetical protein